MEKYPNATLKKARGKHPVARKQLYRISKGINGLPDERGRGIPQHKKYYGALIQAWSFDSEKLFECDSRLEEKLIAITENFLGYDTDDWWFNWTVNTENPNLVEFEKNLSGNWKCYIEQKGKIVYMESGEIENL